MLSAWKDKRTCYHITTSVDNELFDNEQSQKAKRREKRFKTYKSKLAESQGEDPNFIISVEQRNAIVVEVFSSEGEQDQDESSRPKEDQNTNYEPSIPKIVSEYSQFMKGVDLFNQSSSYYRFPHRSIKWYRSIIVWLLEVALNNSYHLYKQGFGDDAVDTLKFRMQIIKEWEREYLQQNDQISEGSEEQEDTTMEVEEQDEDEDEDEEEEHECQLGMVDTALDCDVCSDRSTDRRRTNYVCLNPDCMIQPRRSDRQPRQFRVHRECFHIHLRNQGIL